MDCCSVNGLDVLFNASTARKELKSYRKKGLGKGSRKLVDFLKEQNLAGSTLLEIGGGIGALHLELLKEGAQKAVGVDVSTAYVEAATGLAQELGFADAVEYYVGDFVEQEQKIALADIVLLERVICCYPNMKALVTASAQHAQRLYALTYPRRTWLIRAVFFMMNLGLAILRKRFRIFVHHPQEVAATLASEGFSPIFHSASGIGGHWQIAVYQRK